jgi:putative heme degradation protein
MEVLERYQTVGMLSMIFSAFLAPNAERMMACLVKANESALLLMIFAGNVGTLLFS